MKDQEATERITLRPEVREKDRVLEGTQIEIATTLDGLAEGLTEAEVIDRCSPACPRGYSRPIGFCCGTPHKSVGKSEGSW